MVLKSPPLTLSCQMGERWHLRRLNQAQLHLSRILRKTGSPVRKQRRVSHVDQLLSGRGGLVQKEAQALVGMRY